MQRFPICMIADCLNPVFLSKYFSKSPNAATEFLTLDGMKVVTYTNKTLTNHRTYVVQLPLSPY